MKTTILALALGLAGAAYADEKKHDHHAGHGKGDAKAASQTLKGEIVDLNCYLAHGGKGEKHSKCAKQCVAGGAPMGLATEKGLYLIVGDHGAEKAYAAAKELAGSKAAITGKVSNREGLQAIVVAKAEPAK